MKRFRDRPAAERRLTYCVVPVIAVMPLFTTLSDQHSVGEQIVIAFVALAAIVILWGLLELRIRKLAKR